MCNALASASSASSTLPAWRWMAWLCPGISNKLHASWYCGVPRSCWLLEPPLLVETMRSLGSNASRSRARIGKTVRDNRATTMSMDTAVSLVAGLFQYSMLCSFTFAWYEASLSQRSVMLLKPLRLAPSWCFLQRMSQGMLSGFLRAPRICRMLPLGRTTG